MGKDTPAEAQRNKKKAQGRANRLKSKLEDKNRQQYIEKLRSDRAGERDDISGRSKTWTTGVKERFQPTKKRVFFSVLLLISLVIVAALAANDFFNLPYSPDEAGDFASDIGYAPHQRSVPQSRSAHCPTRWACTTGTVGTLEA